MATGRSAPRVRDPERKQRILASAAALGARRGFHAISMAEIGSEAGIVGSGIYRHFGSKTAILVSMSDQVMDRLADGAATILGAGYGPSLSLSLLVRDHIAVAIEDRDILSIYHREAHTMPPDDWRRLRRSQRHYVEEWVHVLAPLRPDLADGELRLAVHAAIGAIQSILFFTSGLAPDRLAGLLETMAHGCLGTVPACSPVSERELTNS
jgi:AcrR family transcriptional regulator